MLTFLTKIKWFCAILAVFMFWTYGGGYALAEGLDNLDRTRPGAYSNYGTQKPNEPGFDALLAEFKETLQQEDAIDASQLADFKIRLAQEDTKVRAYFSELEDMITQKGLPEEILNRHQEFVREYEAKYETLMAHLTEIESVEEGPISFWDKLGARVTGEQKFSRSEAIAKTVEFLQENTPQPRKSHFDPQNLPFRSLKTDKPIPPKLTPEEWREAFALDASETSPLASTLSAVSDLLVGTAEAQTSPPTAEDLAETIEVQFTPEITQLAADLDNNPVKIFNWVRNNIEFVPTWGSIQGAQLCLDTRECNAFDTSSLLISLFRVSGIPARYQMGTIEVPIEDFMSWGGGFSDPEAAASYFASGGIPSVVRRVDESGEVATVRMEHVWVKAFVDYIPSGGAIQIEGETWVEMDPSFKQYESSTPAVELITAVPFDRYEYLANSTTESPVEFYQQKLENYVSENYPGQTLEDFLTTKSMVSQESSILAANLPYGLLVRGVSFAEIPQSQSQDQHLRQQVSIEVGSGLAYTSTMSELLGKRLTLSFMPASASDMATAETLGGMYFVPPYLLSVKPVLRLDNVEMASGSPIKMGQLLNLTLRVELADGSERTVQNEITVGNYSAILVIPQTLTDELADAMMAEMEPGVVDTRFGVPNIDNSDRDIWVGGGLQMLGAYYFNRLDHSMGFLRRLFSIGQFKTAFQATVSAEVQVASVFGSPRELKVMGYSIDADLLEDIAIAEDGASGPVVAFEKLRGLESSYWEHAVFEVAGVHPGKPGISAVRALQRAITAGIQVYEINTGNLASIEPLLQVSEGDKEAVRNAVNAGLEVTIPVSNVQLGSWQGVGYIVENPLTGAGAYEISGGLSGSIIELRPTGLAPTPVTCQSACTMISEPPLPGAPTAILALGLPVCSELFSKKAKCHFEYEWVNEYTLVETIASILSGYGYKPYIQAATGATLVDFANTGNRTPYDVFFYIGHGSDGALGLRASGEDPSTWKRIYPGDFGEIRRFNFVLLSACATGGDCSCSYLYEEDCYCTEWDCKDNLGYTMEWARRLLTHFDYPISDISDPVLVGYTKVVCKLAAFEEAVQFWMRVPQEQVSKVVNDVFIFPYGYLQGGDPTLPTF